MQLTPENKILLLSAKIHLPDEEVSEVNRLLREVKDWEQLADSLIARGVGPLFYRHMQQLPDKERIPRSAQEKLKQTYYHTLSRNMVLYSVFRKVIKAFTDNGIPAVALKGIHLSEKLYGDIGLRQLSDIDLLVRKADGEKSLKVLREIGFVQSGDEVSHLIADSLGVIHYPAMIFEGVSVEIHIELHREKNNCRLDSEQIIARSETAVIHGVDTQVMEMYDLLIFLCIHLDKHFLMGQVQFTNFMDIVNWIEFQGERTDWQVLNERCKQYNSEDIVYKYLAMVIKYFRVSAPENISAKYGYLLTAQDEKRFIQYLNGVKTESFGASGHIRNIAKKNSLGAKLHYLRMVVFPPERFMRNRFGIRHSSVYWLYYPYRWWIGLKGLWKMITRIEHR